MSDYGGAKELWVSLFDWVNDREKVTVDVEIPWIRSLFDCLADANALIGLARKKTVDVPLTGVNIDSDLKSSVDKHRDKVGFFENLPSRIILHPAAPAFWAWHPRGVASLKVYIRNNLPWWLLRNARPDQIDALVDMLVVYIKDGF
jgi:hypothetical protein